MSTDLIVGFCGETDEQFGRTLDMVKDIRFDKVHSAAYSTREGTIAGRRYEDDVPIEEKKARLRAIDEAQAAIQADINRELLGSTAEVLVEDVKNGRAYGRNRNDKLVHIENASDRVGDVLSVRIDKTGPWSLQGTAVTAA